MEEEKKRINPDSLNFKLARLWKLNVIMIPVAIAAFGTVTDNIVA